MATKLRFFTGDENSFVKTISCSINENREVTGEPKTLEVAGDTGKTRSVQRLAIRKNSNGDKLLAMARADGAASVVQLSEDGTSVSPVHEWTESRFKKDHRFVGLAMTERNVYTCTSSGHLRMTPITNSDGVTPSSQMAYVPTRLCDFRLSSDGETFAYGGDEVDLSVWNTERAFAPKEETAASTVAGQKRKKGKGPELFPGEVWRAKNVANDHLSLRQPIHINSLTYLGPSTSSHHLLTGTKWGSVRRYDTRQAKPVANWTLLTNGEGIKTVEKGVTENEVFVSDTNAHVFSLDLRNGKPIYGYKGISGSVNSLSPALPSYLASASNDRYFRLHSTFPPPETPGQNLSQKGEILTKIYLTSIPTFVLWDGEVQVEKQTLEDDADGVWAEMQDAEDDISSDEDDAEGRRRGKKSRAK